MNILLGLFTAIFIFVLLLFAAVRDYQTREVPNWVWLVGLLGLPLTIFRLGIVGLLLLYGLQILLVFVLTIIGFQLGILGGADGKVVLIISLLYPWIFLNPVWLLVASLTVLIGGFLLLGFHSFWLLLRNILTWNQASKTRENLQRPKKKTFWLSRRLFVSPIQMDQWKQVEVPLVVYFFVVYTLLLIGTSVFV